jgi:hypothetical protein
MTSKGRPQIGQLRSKSCTSCLARPSPPERPARRSRFLNTSGSEPMTRARIVAASPSPVPPIKQSPRHAGRPVTDLRCQGGNRASVCAEFIVAWALPVLPGADVLSVQPIARDRQRARRWATLAEKEQAGWTSEPQTGADGGATRARDEPGTTRNVSWPVRRASSPRRTRLEATSSRAASGPISPDDAA